MTDGPTNNPPVISTAALDRQSGLHVRHPRNERSDIYMTRLSDPAGLTHLGISRAVVPPGKESFALHRHTIQEEWIFVLEGSGHVQLDDRRVPITKGDFMGFVPGGPAHLVCNTSDADLVYLQGGDRREGDRGHFPRLGKIGFVQDDGHMALVDEDAIERLPLTAWIAED